MVESTTKDLVSPQKLCDQMQSAFGVNFILDREIETFEEYLKKIEAITIDDLQVVAKDLFKKEKFNLQIIGPFKNQTKFESLLNA